MNAMYYIKSKCLILMSIQGIKKNNFNSEPAYVKLLASCLIALNVWVWEYFKDFGG